jgi:hypothetical protein
VPASNEIVDSGRGVVFHGVGALTGQEVIEAKEALAAEGERLRGLEYALVLLVEVTEFRITVDEVRAITAIDERLAQFVPYFTVAIVTPRVHDFGVARMWEALLNQPSWTTQVFWDRDAAEAWVHARLR